MTPDDLNPKLDRLDRRITRWLADNSVAVLRVSLGVVFFWFGFLKFFPGLSPASDLASRTIETLSFGLVGPALSLPILATWESLIGLGLIFGGRGGWPMRLTLLLLFLQMIGTAMPVFLFPSEVFTRVPYAPTLEGQYIIKNLVLVAGAMVVGATVRGGKMVSDPQAAERAKQEERRKAES